jgi:hypothetical protein
MHRKKCSPNIPNNRSHSSLRPEPFTFIAETGEEHLDILELIKKHTTIDEPPIDGMDAESVEYQRMRHKEVFGE